MRLKIFLLTALFACFCGVYAQQPQQVVQVKKSTDKVKIDGKIYYIHIVQKGESLYSISRAYGVSQIEIATENPDISLGIKPEQALKIPAKDIPVKEEDNQYIHHIVKKGETLFGLSKQYQVPINEIVKANPDVESGLVLSQVLLIPRDVKLTNEQVVSHDSATFIYHQVKQKEGLYSISKLYNVSIQDIETLNKDVLANGLKFGSVLKIPRHTDVIVASPQSLQVETPKKETLVVEKKNDETTSPVVARCDTFSYAKSKRAFNISLLLPFIGDKQISDTATIDPETGERISDKNRTEKISSKTSNYLDFYEGFLLAIDSMKREGVSVNLSVFNTKQSVSEINELIGEKAIKQSDLIVGPVYPELLKPMAEFAKSNRINIVSPLSPSNSLLKDNSYLFQVNPSYKTQVDEFASNVQFSANQNILIVYEDDSSTFDMVNVYKEGIAKGVNSHSNADAIHIKELIYKPGGVSKEIKERLNQSLTDKKENVILVPSDNEAFVSDLMSHLFALATYHNYDVKVYGFPKWQRFKNIPVEYFYKLNLHLYTPFYVDYSKVNVKKFVSKYRQYYRSEPSQYSFQGYDIALYFLKAMKKYGVDFKFCLNNLDLDLLQSNYRFEQERGKNNGFENRSIYIINYTEDFEIKKVK